VVALADRDGVMLAWRRGGRCFHIMADGKDHREAGIWRAFPVPSGQLLSPLLL
jgi:hypothetical protein